MARNKDLHIRIPKEIFSPLQLLSETRKVSINAIVCSAVEEFLEKKNLEGIDLVLEKIATLENRMRSLRLDIENLGELFSFFVYYWFCYTPAFPENQRRIVAVEGRKRHQQFLSQLAKKLGQGEFSLGEVFRVDNDGED